VVIFITVPNFPLVENPLCYFQLIIKKWIGGLFFNNFQFPVGGKSPIFISFCAASAWEEDFSTFYRPQQKSQQVLGKTASTFGQTHANLRNSVLAYQLPAQKVWQQGVFVGYGIWDVQSGIPNADAQCWRGCSEKHLFTWYWGFPGTY